MSHIHKENDKTRTAPRFLPHLSPSALEVWVSLRKTMKNKKFVIGLLIAITTIIGTASANPSGKEPFGSFGIGLNPGAATNGQEYEESITDDEGRTSSFSVLQGDTVGRITDGFSVGSEDDFGAIAEYLSKYTAKSIGNDWTGNKVAIERSGIDIMTASQVNGFFTGASTEMTWTSPDATWVGSTNSVSRGYSFDGEDLRRSTRIDGAYSCDDATASTVVSVESLNDIHTVTGAIDYNLDGHQFQGYIYGDADSDKQIANYALNAIDDGRFIVSMNYVVEGNNVSGEYVVDDKYLFDSHVGSFEYVSDEPNVIHDLDAIARDLHILF